MSTVMVSLRRKMNTAHDLKSVVRTMKAMSAVSISEYEHAVLALNDYCHTVELGLSAVFRNAQSLDFAKTLVNFDSAQYRFDAVKLRKNTDNQKYSIGAIVFGSDQGLVGQFNDNLASFVMQELTKYPENKMYWAVGERMQARLIQSQFVTGKTFSLPNSVRLITPLVSELLIEASTSQQQGKVEQVYLFYNQPKSKNSYCHVCQKLLPLDEHWQQSLGIQKWPTYKLPQLINTPEASLRALVREYLFVSIFKACAASLASENASRLMAMQRAEKNIEELQNNLQHAYHQQRQDGIDQELLELVSGYEALFDTS